MKIFRLFLIITIAIAIGFFSWSYYTGKTLEEKHDRAKLVLKESCNAMTIPDWRDSSVYE